jgi:hypothetical protein
MGCQSDQTVAKGRVASISGLAALTPSSDPRGPGLGRAISRPPESTLDDRPAAANRTDRGKTPTPRKTTPT